MGNTLLSLSHEETIAALNSEFQAEYSVKKDAYDHALAEMKASDDPASSPVTFGEDDLNQCYLILLSEYLVAVTFKGADETPVVHDVVELESEDDIFFGPIQPTGTLNTLKITSALQTTTFIKFATKDSLKAWESTLALTKHTLTNENSQETRTRSLRTRTIDDPFEKVTQALSAVSERDVHWTIGEDGSFQGPDDVAAAAAAAEVKPKEDGASSADAVRDLDLSQISRAELHHGTTTTAENVAHSGLLDELRGGRVLSRVTKHSKWVEIVDDVLIYYDWDKQDTIPTRDEKLSGSPKFIDLECIDDVQLGGFQKGSIFGACCGSARNLDDSLKMSSSSDDTGAGGGGNASGDASGNASGDASGNASGNASGDANDNKMKHGFSIYFQKNKKSVCVTFATSDDDQANKWVQMIEKCHPCTPKNTRDVETFEKFMANCNNGDILLFRGKKINNKLLRGITGSKYDHVGLVIKGPAGPYLFDATGDGICLHTFKKFHRKKWYRPYQYVCRRALKWKNEETGKYVPMPERYVDKLHTFVEATVGMHYRLTPSSLLRNNKAKEKKKKGYFCSELVAAAYQATGLLPEEPQAQLYWPGTFQHRLISTAKFNERMWNVVGSGSGMHSSSDDCTGLHVRPILDKQECRILWDGVDNIPTTSSSKRGGCFG